MLSLLTQTEEAAGALDSEGFDPGAVIIEHVANSGLDHPIIHIPFHPFGIDFSVTKHVLMLWVVAFIVFVAVTFTVRRYLRQGQLVPAGFMNPLEAVVEFIRDTIVEPNVGRRWVHTWTPLLLTFFLFILTANAIGLVPVFEVVGLVNHALFQSEFVEGLLHGGATATSNYNVTAGLATVTFFAIMAAGTMAHGFVRHWKNLVPPGLAKPVYILLIPIELMGMFVKPFALTMRLAANMTGGHIAILAILSMVFLFTDLFGTAVAGMGIGVFVSVPLAAAITGLEIIVVLVQAYVFTLLTAVFIGMAIHAHH
jgi:F-type H+-transporting ATPase subunit a